MDLEAVRIKVDDLGGEMRVVSYRLGQVEDAVKTRADTRDVADLDQAVSDLRSVVSAVQGGIREAAAAIDNAKTRSENRTRVLIAVIGLLGILAGVLFS